MARFKAEIPDEILKDVNYIDSNFEKIFGGMTQAGAQVALNAVWQNMPESLKQSFGSDNVTLTRVYRTPTDDGINTKVIVTGYFINSRGKKTPAPLVANQFEYGRSYPNFPVQPFFRKSFKKNQIKQEMMEAQKKLSGGILDE